MKANPFCTLLACSLAVVFAAAAVVSCNRSGDANSSAELRQQPPPPVSIDGSKISVSGVSSGAYMAVQLHVAFSRAFMGVGAVAGGPYFCAQNNTDVTAVKTLCMAGVGLPSDPSIFVNEAKTAASNGQIDPVENMEKNMVYIFNSSEDQIINPLLGLLTNEFYQEFISDTSNIEAWAYIPDYGPTYPVAHGMPSNISAYDDYLDAADLATPCSPANSQTYPWFPNPFLRGNDPWIYHCNYGAVSGYDMAYQMLNHIYSSLKNPTTPDQSHVYVLAQLPFVSDPDIKTVADLNAHGIGENAYVYVPAACAGGETPCKLHIALHGCQQFPEWSFVGKVGSKHAGETVQFGDKFYFGPYNATAESNEIVVLYPQAYNIGTSQSDTNPYGCWEFWPFFEKDADNYYTKAGRQMTMIYGMIDHFAGTPDERRGGGSPK